MTATDDLIAELQAALDVLQQAVHVASSCWETPLLANPKGRRPWVERPRPRMRGPRRTRPNTPSVASP
jgi:hypothetical protein